MSTKGEMPNKVPEGSRWTFWICFAIVLVTGVVFLQVLYNDFTWWDDHLTIHHNPRLNPPTWEGVLHYWRRPYMSLYVPVTYTVWSALAWLPLANSSGNLGIQLSPIPFHAASVMLHAASAVIVFLLLRRLTGRAWPTVAGALLFALHPVQVEPVAWASGLKDVLAGFFSLLALLQYVRSRQEEGRNARTSYVLALVAFVLATLSKPSAVVVPVLVGVVDALFLGQPVRRAMKAVGPWLLWSLAVTVIAKWSQPALMVERTPLWMRPLIAGDALAFYLGKLIVPVGLTVDYARTPAYVRDSGMIWFTWIVPAIVAVVALFWRRRAPWLLGGALLFVVALSPVLGLVPFEFQSYSTVADHYLYVPMLGIAVAVAFGLSRVSLRVSAPIVTIVLVALAALTVRQTQHWRDDPSVWNHTTRVSPRSWLAHNNLGAWYTMIGDDEAAEAACRKALELNPDAISARENLARCHAVRGEHEIAVEHLRRAIQSAEKLPPPARPDLTNTYLNLSRSLERIGRRTPTTARTLYN